MIYTIEGRQGLGTIFSEPQRNWTFLLRIPQETITKVLKISQDNSRPISNVLPNNLSIASKYNPNTYIDKLVGEEDFLIKCRGASIPSKIFQDITSSFYGNKRKFPSKVEFEHNLDLEFEEVERQTFKKFFELWQSGIHNTNFRNDNGDTLGYKRLDESEYMSNIIVSFVGYNGIPLDKNITFYNCWPKEVKNVGLSYSSNEIIRYGVSFSFDYWELTQEPIVDIPVIGSINGVKI